MIEHKPEPQWVAVEEFLSDVVVRPGSPLKRAVTSAVEAGILEAIKQLGASPQDWSDGPGR